ncbi:MAG: MltA domain-containing protein, partial [Thermodesulfobacteriota bacterium]
MSRRLLAAGLVLAFLCLPACPGPEPPGPGAGRVMIRLDPEDWPGLADDLDPDSLATALERSRSYLRRLRPDRTFNYGEDAYTAAHLLASLDEFERLYKKTGPGPEMSRELKNRFVLYRSVGSDGKGRVLFTGYYEPELAGALAPDERFRWPVYGPPDDLIEADLGAFLPELEGS